MKCGSIYMTVILILLVFHFTLSKSQINGGQKKIDSITVLFMGSFDFRTRYLMIYLSDTVCIDIYPGEFSAHYPLPFPKGINDGDTLPITFYQMYKKRRKWHYYFDTELPVRYLKNKSVLYVTTDVMVSSQPYSGYYNWLSYFWYK